MFEPVNGREVDMDFEKYKSLDRVNSSLVKVIASKSAKHAFEGEIKSSPALTFGSAVHEYLLEQKLPPDPEDIYFVFAGQRRGQAWKDHVLEAEQRGKVATTSADFAKEVAKRDSLIRQLERIENGLPNLARELIYGGTHYERTILFEFEQEGDAKNIPAKARLDIIYDGDDGISLIADIKTTSKGVGMRDVKAATVAYFYDLQGAFYVEAAKSLANSYTANKVDFNFIFIESSPPYDVGIYSLGQEGYENGLNYLHRSLPDYVAAKIGWLKGKWDGTVRDIEIPEYHLCEPWFSNLEKVAL